HSAYIPLAIILLIFTVWSPLGAQEIRIPVASKSRGMPAYPFPVTVEQPDGTNVRIRGMGDRMLRLYETEDGYTVLQDKKGTYMYATLDAEQQLVSSGVAVGASKGAPDGIQKHLRYSPEQADAAEKAYFTDTDSKANPTPFPTSGTNNVLVILAEFADRTSSLPASELENMMSAPNHNGTGSFRDYYLEVSYSNLTLEPTVTPWVQVSQNMTYYGGNDAFGYDLRPHELVREAVELVEATGFDFSQFDNNNDGYVDEIILIHAGYGEQFIGSGDTAIWSHTFHLGDLAVEYDGVMLDNYIICPELFGSSGTQLNSIGTVVHEFAHSLAIPDIYDIDLEGSGGYAFDPNFWDLMAVGSWNNNGNTPAGINAWLKRYMGWMTIPVIDSTGIFTLNPAIDHQEAYQLNTPVYNEYFIVENRQRTGFDSYLPGEGMLVYHVDLNHPGWLTGEMNVDPAHQGFDLEEADNIRDTLTLAGDAFPGTANVTSFDSLSVPGSNTWDGNTSGVSLQNISLSGSVISFEILNNTFSALPPGWIVDELSFMQMGTVTGIPVVSGDTAVSGYLGAFVGEECRGVGSAVYHPGTGRHLFRVNVFSNSTGGEELQFRYYDPVSDSVYSLYETLPFATDSIAGDTVQPFIFHTPVHYTRNFAAGWNWFSLNLEMQDMSPGAVLAACNTPDDYVKGHVSSARYYDGYGWYGKLKQMSSADLYIIRVAAASGIDAEGVAAHVPGKERTLYAGWNWVSYTPQEPIPINEALASLTPTQGDYIKNQVSTATYYDGWGWVGKMAMMYPGQGYMMKVANDDVLVYPVAGSAKKALGDAGIEASGAVEGADLPAGSHSFVPTIYQHNGSLTASVIFDGGTDASEADVLSAWYGDEIRGQVNGMYFGPADQVLFPLMVHSNAKAGEALTFRYYHAASGISYKVEESIEFEKDMVAGDALQAVELHADMSSGAEAVTIQDKNARDIAPSMHAWPNPFSGKVNIAFTVPEVREVRLEIYDIYGSLVEEVTRGIFGAGAHRVTWQSEDRAPGTYYMKFSAGDRQVYKRIICTD
ncbi:MAG: M6 family metalloprotease domain-containing protein, partial [Bacteroidales bacterium]|nr:M6 family metalloprotease domain-containing protein [Bacteroidales bacterium]